LGLSSSQKSDRYCEAILGVNINAFNAGKYIASIEKHLKVGRPDKNITGTVIFTFFQIMNSTQVIGLITYKRDTLHDLCIKLAILN